MQLNDSIVAAVLNALGTQDENQLNDLLLAYFRRLGATAYQLTDAEWQFLRIYAPSSPDKELNDLWYFFLRGQGYTGSLNDMLLAFWSAGGVIPPVSEGNFIAMNADNLIAMNGDNFITQGGP